MKKSVKRTLFAVAALLLLISWPAYKFYSEISKAMSEDPLVWEADIAALEKKTAGRFAPGEGVVFVGSSSIRLWSTLEQDMAPIPVIQHGFGGAKIQDVVHYADRLITNYQPRAVVVFVATNDITPEAAKPPRVVLAAYQALIEKIRRENADLPVFYIAITPSILRWSVWDVAQQVNALIAQWSKTQRNLYVIDTGAALLNADGEPDDSNYVIDGLHLSEAGYRIWTRLIKPPLLAELGLSTDNT
ncbi:MAG: GDSL-type esterase/lipase family protein [Gammaproteobacteria bacterium]|nr:GDSL-type esterase/lipase family protein [Gammaproteobacteria bacterium]